MACIANLKGLRPERAENRTLACLCGVRAAVYSAGNEQTARPTITATNNLREWENPT
jgi:hypothetical protein